MRIPMDLVLNRLEYLNPLVRVEDRERWIKGVKLLPARCQGLSEEYLYLGVYEDYARVEGDLLLAAVSPPGAPPPAAGQYILLRTEESLADIFNELLGLQLRLQTWELELEQALSSGLGLQRLLDLSEPVLGNPIVVLDPALKTLACTRAFDTEDPVFADLLNLGYLAQKQFNSLRDNHYFTPDHYTGETLLLPPSSIKQYTSTLTAILDGTRVRYLVLMLFSNYDYSRGMFQLFQFFLEKIRACLSSGSAVQGEQREQYEFFLLDLLDGRCTDPEEIAERGACFLGPEGLDYNCVVIRLNRGTDMYRKHARLTLANLLPRWKPILYRDCILVHPRLEDRRAGGDSETGLQLLRLIDFLEETDAVAGISERFRSYADVALSYRQGLAALKLGSGLTPDGREGRLYRYSDYRVFQILEEAARGLPPGELCSRRLLELRDYDRAHRTSYFAMLECFLRHERSYTRTAAELHMHRNNVIYHIGRLRELFDLELDDPEVRLQLLLSCKAVRLWDGQL